MRRSTTAHRVTTAFSIALWALAGAVAASEPTAVTGHWEGEIEIPGRPLGFDVDFTVGEDGALRGDISIPVQGLSDLELVDVGLDGEALRFRIPGIPGEPTFEGSLGEGTVRGTFRQGGAELTFTMARGDDPAARARAALEGFSELAAGAIVAWEVPGLSIAVVAGGEVVFAEGFGRRDLDGDLPMTPDTLQPIGSTTKAFTTTLLAMLVDEGKLAWDEPLVRFLPEFRLADPLRGQLVTPRDLVTHRSGLPRHDLVWYNNNDATRAELVASLEHLEASAGLRERFQYNNLMFVTAGHLAERLTGASWEEAVEARLLAPLGMARTTPSLAAMQADADHALPYREEDGELIEIPYRRIDLVGPAGSLNSSVNELARWLEFNLAGGKVGDRRLLNATTLADVHAPRIPTGGTPERREISPRSYALGWFVDSYRGHRRLEHGGGIDGFVATVVLFPDDGVGIAALANVASALPDLLARHAADRVLGLEAIDWNAEGLAERAAGEKTVEEGESKKASLRRTGTAPSHPLAEYAGDYEHPGYGSLAVEREGDRLAVVYNGIEAPLEHWHFDIWRGAETDGDPTFEDMPFQFLTGVNGDVAGVEAAFEPTVDPIRFARRPDARLGDPTHLARLAGTYSLPPQVLTIELSGSTLSLSLPGQPRYTLAPALGGRFSLAEVPIIEVGFELGETGPATAVTFYQPNGVFTATRVE